jgi:hypothetical protein
VSHWAHKCQKHTWGTCTARKNTKEWYPVAVSLTIFREVNAYQSLGANKKIPETWASITELQMCSVHTTVLLGFTLDTITQMIHGPHMFSRVGLRKGDRKWCGTEDEDTLVTTTASSPNKQHDVTWQWSYNCYRLMTMTPFRAMFFMFYMSFDSWFFEVNHSHPPNALFVNPLLYNFS